MTIRLLLADDQALVRGFKPEKKVCTDAWTWRVSMRPIAQMVFGRTTRRRSWHP